MWIIGAIIVGVVAVGIIFGSRIWKFTAETILDIDNNESDIENQTREEDNSEEIIINENITNQTVPSLSVSSGGGGGGSSGGGSSGTPTPSSELTRSFSSNTINMGDELIVTLSVEILNSETFYMIEDQIPSGFEILDPGTGNITSPGYIKWVEYENCQSNNYNYTLNATQNGSFIFQGDYAIEGFSDITTTSGETTIVVV